MDVDAVLARLEQTVGRGRIAARRDIPRRDGHDAVELRDAPPPFQGILARAGYDRLYSHQAQALTALHRGENVVICTGTASGKSLCFQTPILAAVESDTDATALCIFPAKALAYDQLAGFERLIAAIGIDGVARPACFDGDTPPHKRAAIRRAANIVLTNPDMLHVGILPYHAKWALFLSRLKYVVLDELHMYRGIFGSHVAGVVRRLLRVCRHYGATPQIVSCSATLGNPRELSERISGAAATLIDRDGSPCGRKTLVVWNPPPIDGASVGRRSGNLEAQELMERLLESGAGVITFCKARVVAELIYKYLHESLSRRSAQLAASVRPYRGGYLPQERREIESALFSGRVRGVCTTNALELGIDVGSLDAAIVVGFPGTLCSFWQQAGRAGRRQDDSLVLFVAYDDPVDQHICRSIEFLFDRPLEHAIIDPQNPHILAAQLSCAAAELPIDAADVAYFGPLAGAVADALVQEGRVRHSQARYYWARSDMPAIQTGLRTISNATFAIVDTTDDRNEVLAQVDSISAPELVYPQAVYLHRGESYVVRQLDLELRLARVERFDADYYTQPVLASSIRLTQMRESHALLGGTRGVADVCVRWQTTAFKKIKFRTMEMIGQTALDLPPQQINTTALCLVPPRDALRAAEATGRRSYEALAGARNLLVVAMAPLVMSDRYDIGGIVDSAQLGEPAIWLYDRYEGGVGYARHAHDAATQLLALALRIAADCPCEVGCPACVGPTNLRVAIHHDPDLQHGYDVPDKRATVALLSAWVGWSTPALIVADDSHTLCRSTAATPIVPM